MPQSRPPQAAGFEEYETLLLDVSRLLEQARQSAGRAVNSVMTATYWHIGRRIVEQEQKDQHEPHTAKNSWQSWPGT
jgi:hypothetical protein